MTNDENQIDEAAELPVSDTTDTTETTESTDTTETNEVSGSVTESANPEHPPVVAKKVVKKKPVAKKVIEPTPAPTTEATDAVSSSEPDYIAELDAPVVKA